MCTRNVDEFFQEGNATVCAGGRHCDGNKSLWMIMTRHVEDCVEVTVVKLDDETKLVTDVIIVHKGDSTCKEMPFDIFIKDNCKNVAGWLWEHRMPRPMFEDLKFFKVAKHTWTLHVCKMHAIHQMCHPAITGE